MSELENRFNIAAQEVKQLPTRPNNDTLLRLYALYKQATVGDVSGSRPGGFDFEAKAKYAAWSRLKGTAKEDAMQAYIELVKSLKGRT